MARLDFKFIAAASPTVPTALGLDDIPKDVIADVEEVYEALRGNPNGSMEVAFKDKGELAQWEALAKRYCQIRPAGEIRYRRSPARNMPENAMRFRIVDIPREREAETEAIREASAKAGNTAAKKTTAKAAK